MQRTRAIIGLSALLAVGVAAGATVVLTRDAASPSQGTIPLPKDRPTDAAPAFQPYRSPIGERFSTSIPGTWTASPSASGEGTSITFEDRAAATGMRIYFFHDFVSEQGVREHLSRTARAMQGTARSRQWPWSFVEYETAWLQGDTRFVGAIGIGHTGNRWYEVSWQAPEGLASTHRVSVDGVLKRLVWDDAARRLVRGVVEERSAGTGTIRLAGSEDKLALVAEHEGTRVVWDNGRPASVADVRPGMRIEAVGLPPARDVLHADRIVLASGHPEIGVG